MDTNRRTGGVTHSPLWWGVQVYSEEERVASVRAYRQGIWDCTGTRCRYGSDDHILMGARRVASDRRKPSRVSQVADAKPSAASTSTEDGSEDGVRYTQKGTG